MFLSTTQKPSKSQAGHAAPSHRGHRTFRATKPWLTSPGILLLGAVALVAQPAAADFLTEVHVINLGNNNPTPASVFQYNFDLPLFDTAGGTRELIGFRVDYRLYSDYTYTVNANPTADWHGCSISWQHNWSSTLNGEQWFPLDQPSGYLNAGSGLGAVRGPFSAAEPPYQGFGAGIGHSEAYDDPALLATLTGAGIVSVECTHSLTDLVVAPPPERQWPAQAPLNQRVFDPDLVDVTVDRIGIDITLSYYWTPEPTSLVLLGLGAVALLRRR